MVVLYVERLIDMKFLITGDLHLRASNPENRIDNFFETQLNKVEQIFQIATKNRCEYILCPGDVFDNPRPSFDVLEYYIKLFNKYSINNGNNNEIQFLTVWGQHDQRFRTKDRTALKLMESLGYMQTFKHITFGKYIDLYGCDYGDEIPVIEDMDNFNILLIHKTILEKPIWKGQEDFLQSDKLAKKYPYDIIISGDWHHPVFYKYKEQTIVNCGCLVRKTLNEADLIPHVYMLEIKDGDLTYELINLPIIHKPADVVFKPEALERTDKKENQKLQEFINSIKNNEIGSSLDFRKNLEIAMKPMEQNVKDIIIKAFEEIEK